MIKLKEQICCGSLFVYIITDLDNDWETLSKSLYQCLGSVNYIVSIRD